MAVALEISRRLEVAILPHILEPTLLLKYLAYFSVAINIDSGDGVDVMHLKVLSDARVLLHVSSQEVEHHEGVL